MILYVEIIYVSNAIFLKSVNKTVHVKQQKYKTGLGKDRC